MGDRNHPSETHWRRLEEHLHDALQREAAERPAFIDATCGDDRALRDELHRLLATYGKLEDGFLEPIIAVVDGSARRSVENTQDRAAESDASLAVIGRRMGPFALNRLIAVGGMGAVYEATQDHPHRTVAVKVLRAGIASAAMLRRFEHETEILGHLHHPGIAQIFEAGTTDTGDGQRPFFAMELIEGRPLTEYAEAHQLGTRERLELFAELCDAVQHAHLKGVIHRDLKPGNVLVDESGQLKVLDFGVARTTDTDVYVTTLHTDLGQLIGTLAYMSPEQVDGDPRALDTRSDVYSLGVVLYELLTEEMPYEVSGTSLARGMQIIKEESPRRSSSINRALRGDVETITLKALEKGRERRYQSAAELAQDIRRYLDRQPVAARPPTLSYQFRRLVARHKGMSVLAGMLFFSLAVFSIGMTFLYVRATRAERTAEAKAETATQVSASLIEMLEGLDPFHGDPDELVNVTLTPCEILDRTLATVTDQLKDQPEENAKLLFAIGTVYHWQGRYDRAAEVLQTALEDRQRVLGDEHPDVASTLLALGQALRNKGAYAEAQVRYRQAAEVWRRVEGDDHPEVALSLAWLAQASLDKGDVRGAQVPLHEALAIMRARHGNGDERLAYISSAVANVLRGADDHADAEALFRQALAIYRKLPEDFAPTVGRNMQWLAGALWDRGDCEGAKAVASEALTWQRQHMGDEHPDVASALNTLAALLHASGDFDEAEDCLREALDIQRRVLGQEHLSVACSLGALSNVLRAKRSHDEAEQHARQALDIRRRVLGQEHPLAAHGLLALCSVLQARGSYDKAEQHARQALEIYSRAFGQEHPFVANSLVALSGVRRARGSYDEAEQHARQALDIRRRVLGAEHSSVANSLAQLGALLQETHSYHEAETCFRQALDIRRRAFGAEHPSVTDSLCKLGAVLREKHSYDEAETCFAEALEIQVQVLGHEHLDVAATHGHLAHVHRWKGEYGEAAEHWRQALAIRRKHLPPTHVKVVHTAESLGSMLCFSRDFAAAEELYREILPLLRNELGDDHERVGTVCCKLAGVLLARDDYAGAAAVFRDVCTPEQADLELATAMGNHGLDLKRQGDFAGAEAEFRQALAIMRKHLGDSNPTVAAVQYHLGVALYQKGDHADALAVFRGLCPLYVELHGENGPATLQLRATIALSLGALSEYEEAELLLQETYTGKRELLGEQHHSTNQTLHDWASVLHAKGDLKQAESKCLQCLEAAEKITFQWPHQRKERFAALYHLLAKIRLDQGNPVATEEAARRSIDYYRRIAPYENHEIALVKSLLGECLTRQRRFEEAEPLVIESFPILEETYGAREPRTLDALQRIIHLYEAWSRLERAAEWRAKLPQAQ